MNDLEFKLEKFEGPLDLLLHLIDKNKVDIYDIPISLITEQYMEYLDRMTSAIDRKIELLNRKLDACARLKKSVIHHAVTHGLDPNAPMKDSGVEWIGKVPEHWTGKRIKDIVTLNTLKSNDNSETYIALENIVSWDARFIVTEAETEGTNNVFSRGDILWGKLRPYLAKGFIPDYDGICSSEFFVLTTNKDNFRLFDIFNGSSPNDAVAGLVFRNGTGLPF